MEKIDIGLRVFCTCIVYSSTIYVTIMIKKIYEGQFREGKLAIIHAAAVRLNNNDQENLDLNLQKCSTMIEIGLMSVKCMQRRRNESCRPSVVVTYTTIICLEYCCNNPATLRYKLDLIFEYTGSDWIQCFPTSDPVI